MRIISALKFTTLALCVLSLGHLLPLTHSKPVKSDQYKIVCYIGTWAYYRNDNGKFTVDDIDPNLCTHIIYGFAKLNESDQIEALDPYLDLEDNYGVGYLKKLNGLKEKNPDLKTLIAIGGWNEGSTKYSNMASKPDSRQRFVQSTISFLDTHGLDGLDLDWEYPCERGGVPSDRENFVLLLKELKESFEPYGYLLSAAVGAHPSKVVTSYQVKGICEYLDFVNIMAYDYYGSSWSKYTGHNAPLNSRSNEDNTTNIRYSIERWIQEGAPSKKLNLGVPFYGRTFTLADASDTSPNAKFVGPGDEGPITYSPGSLGYNEICVRQKEEKYQVIFEETWRAPYMVKGDQWVGFDNQKSVKEKMDFVKEHKLGGAMVWSLDTDDFRGDCGDGKFPLLKTIHDNLDQMNGNNTKRDDSKEYDSTTITQTNPTTKDEAGETDPTSITSTEFTSKKQISTSATLTSTSKEIKPSEEMVPFEYLCNKNGWYASPLECSEFVRCVVSGKSMKLYYFKCPEGTHFNETLTSCIHIRDSTCVERK